MACLLVACSSGPVAVSDPIASPVTDADRARAREPEDVAVGGDAPTDVRDEARSVLSSQLDGFRRLDPGAFAWAYADDAFVFGPFADEVLLGRHEARAAAVRDMAGQGEGPLEMTTMASRIGANGPDVAWAMDDVSVGVPGQAEPSLFRVSSLLARRSSELRIVAQSFALCLPADFVDEQRVGETKQIDEDIGEGAEASRRALGELLVGTWRPAPPRSRDDVFFSGPAAADAAAGAARFGRALAGYQDELKSGAYVQALTGGVHARAFDGVAFTAFQVSRAHRGDPVERALRGFVIWETAGGTPTPVVATLTHAPPAP